MKSKFFVSLLGLLILTTSFASDVIPVGPQLKEKLDRLFFNTNNLELLKVQSFETQIQERIKELTDIIVSYEVNKKGKTLEKALEKASEEDTIVNLNLILKTLEQLRAEPNTLKQYKIAEKIIDIDNGVRVEITPVNENTHLLERITEFFKPYKIYKKANPRYGEAANLINPETGRFFSQDELERLISQGFDISKLDPPAKNGVIELLDDISKIDVKKKYEQGDNDLHRGLDITWPATNVGTLKKIRKTQSRPKVIFKALDTNGVEKEWKLKMQMEIHSEPTAASLASTLGLYTDVSKFVDEFKIYLDDMDYDEFVVEYASYFEFEALHDLIASRGTDENGEYIIFKEGLLEARFDDKDINRIGPFYPTQKRGKRETRAWQIFNLWINNTDIKAGENNKLAAREIDGELRLFGFQHDLGFGFGYLQREKPTNFSWNLVSAYGDQKIIFNFRSLIPNEGWEHVTYNDGRWFTRKIAQMTREQITAAVELGNWPNQSPYNYEALLVEKLIARRNQMVKVFGLLGETLPNGQKIELMEFSREVEKDAIETTEKIPGETVDFREEINQYFVSSPLETLNDIVASSANAIVSGISKISLGPVWYGIDDYGIVAEVLTDFNREVVANPTPKGEDDLYIVRENWALGVRLGKGFGTGVELIGDTAYVKSYSLIYPVTPPEEAKKRSKFMPDFKMPYRVLKQGLPKKHIFITENFIEGRGRVKLGSGVMLTPGLENSRSKIVTGRTILVHDMDGSVSLIEDRVNATQKEMEVFLELGLIKLRQLESFKQDGKIKRYITKLDGKTEDIEMQRAIDSAVFNHDFSLLTNYPHQREIKSDYIEKSSNLSLLGFVSWEKNFRVDDLEIFSFDKKGDLLSLDYQLNATLLKQAGWSWLLNGETKYKNLKLNSTYNVETNEMINPYIEINIGSHDLNTVSNEISESYLPFFNGVAGKKDFFKFTPEMHAYNNRWGEIEFLLTQRYHSEAIEKILTMNLDDFKYSLADAFGISHAKIDRQWAWNTSSKFKQERMQRPEILRLTFFGKTYEMDRIIKKADRFFDKVQNAKQERSRKDKVEELLRAMESIIPRKSDFYSPVYLYVLNKFVGIENYLITAQMIIPEALELENKLPAEMKPYFQQGTKREKDKSQEIIMRVTDALELYHSVF